MVLAALLLLTEPPVEEPAKPVQLPYQRVYQTSKTEATIEKCLIAELSDLGEQTLIRDAANTTLMIRDGLGRPLLIEIEPPHVTVTTRAAPETQKRIERCVRDD